MDKYLGIDAQTLAAEKSAWTAREIVQQPEVWEETQSLVERDRKRIGAWLRPRLDDTNLRIVLCGAGTSAYIGETLAPWLGNKLRRRVDAVSTTSLVGNPDLYLARHVPTLMISFARSGDSPESVACVDLGDHLVDRCHHLVITCNADGKLAKMACRSPEMLCVRMPEASNDRGFAMTSSYTSMLLACATIFAPQPESLRRSIDMARLAVAAGAARARGLASPKFDRLVVLGSGCLLGTAHEACLKCLELTNGRIMALFESPLGFRHGPKSVVDDGTFVVLLRSVDPYTRRYDQDLLDELLADDEAGAIMAIGPEAFDDDACGLDDFWLSLPYIVFCQMLAFFLARALGNSVDDPCPSGQVNRVVQGVTIHPYRSLD